MSDIPLLFLLRELKVSSTFALTPGRYVANTRRWNCERLDEYGVCIPPEQLFEYDAFDVWSHSNMHIRHDLSPAEDYATAKEVLSSLFRRSIDGFCFPYGDVTPKLLAAANQAGYRWLRAGPKTPRFENPPPNLLWPNCTWRDPLHLVYEAAERDGYALMVSHTYELKTREDWHKVYTWYRDLHKHATTLTALCDSLGI